VHEKVGVGVFILQGGAMRRIIAVDSLIGLLSYGACG